MTRAEDSGGSPRRWIGLRVPQREDRLLVQGRGTYVDDLHLPGMLYMTVVRSPYAHARLQGVDPGGARSRPGVVLVLTGDAVAAATEPFAIPPAAAGTPAGPRPLRWYALATDRVLYSGQPVAAVVATDRYLAEDAAEAVTVAYEPLGPVASVDDALRPQAPVLHEGWPDNVLVEYRYTFGDVDAAVEAADLIIEEELAVHRHTAMPLETRGLVAAYDGDRLTVWASTQWPHVLRGVLAACLRVPEHRIRVIAPNVGGGFGVKYNLYPEDVLVPLAAMCLRRPVKWVEDRREHFQATAHAREQRHRVTLALRRDGTLLALRTCALVDLGAGTIFPAGTGSMFAGAASMPMGYRIQNYEYRGLGVVTNKTPYGAYRGFGVTEVCQVLEQAIDVAARRLGLDPAELRLRNWIGPEDLPYRTATGGWLSSGSFRSAIEAALEASDYWGFRRRQAAARAQGRLLGIGVAAYVEGSGASQVTVTGSWGNWEYARVLPMPDGRVVVYSGLASQGQSHQTMLAQVVAEELGIDLDDVTVILGDTDSVTYGMGAFASRGAMIGGAAAVRACADLKEKLCRVGAFLLEANPEDVEYRDGGVQVRGAPQRRIGLQALARLSYTDARLRPPRQSPVVEGVGTFDMADVERPADPFGRTPRYAQWSDGCCVATCEVDPETGRVAVTGLWIAHDCGRVINPVALDGQFVGGLAQSVGGVLLEELVYDAQGQLLTTSFMDYLLPTTLEVPPVRLMHLESLAPEIPGGFKGAGESANIVGPAAIVGAVADALAQVGARLTTTPLTPARILAALREARGAGLSADCQRRVEA